MSALDEASAELLCAFLSRALVAARANASWPDLRAAAAHVSAVTPAVAGSLGPTLSADDNTGLPPYEVWARVKADHQVARDEGTPHEPLHVVQERASSSPAAGQRLARRRYHDALRATPPPRLADLDVAVRAQLDRGARKLHIRLDKVEGDGALVRLTVDLTLAAAVDAARLRDLLFPLASLPVELTLVRLLAERGVVDVERVTRGAVDLAACVPAGVVAPPLDEVRAIRGAAVCAFAFSTCAQDITPGDNDPLPHEAPPLAALARQHLGARRGALAHRVFRDRKLVATRAAAPVMKALVARAGTKTVLYTVEVP